MTSKIIWTYLDGPANFCTNNENWYNKKIAPKIEEYPTKSKHTSFISNELPDLLDFADTKKMKFGIFSIAEIGKQYFAAR